MGANDAFLRAVAKHGSGQESPKNGLSGRIFAFQNSELRANLPSANKTVVVAQLVEPQIVILVVAGSSPVDHPIFSIGTWIREEGKEPRIVMQPLESRIDYKFRNSLLLAEALTHPSLAYESQKPHFDNQRLEFLGDAVIQLIITEELFHRFPAFPAGQLTKLRSRLVSRAALAKFANEIHLGDYILLGKGEQASGGNKRHSTLADAFEAQLRRMDISPPHRFECGNNQTLLAMVAAGTGWTITTPLLFSRARRFHPEVEMHRFPGKGFARTLAILANADCSRSVLNLVDESIRTLIDDTLLTPFFEKTPWLKDSLKLID